MYGCQKAVYNTSAFGQKRQKRSNCENRSPYHFVSIFSVPSGICNFDCFLALALVPLILTMMIRLYSFMTAVSAPKGS